MDSSRTEPGPNVAHKDTKRGYLLRSYVRCGLCDQRMFGKTRHGRAYYNCYPANNNADRLDRYPTDHPKAGVGRLRSARPADRLDEPSHKISGDLGQKPCPPCPA